MIFHHAPGRFDSRALTLARSAFAGGHPSGGWMYAVTVDAARLRRGLPQAYGTQYRRDVNGEWRLATWSDDVPESQREALGLCRSSAVPRTLPDKH